MNTFVSLRSNVLWLALTALVGACRTAELVAPILADDPLTASQVSLVSIQPKDATSAEVIVKSTRLSASNWHLTASTSSGSPALIPIETTEIVDFTLTRFQLSGLKVGQTYQFRLAFRFADQDSLTALRTYIHQSQISPHWTRLAHAPFSGGDYSGYPVAMDGICGADPMNGCGYPGVGAYVGNQVQILRYPGPAGRPSTMDVKYYDRATDRWIYYSSLVPQYSRHAVIQYNLFFRGVDRYRFTGLGYITEERAPNKYFYYRDMFAVFPVKSSDVLPGYQGEDGEIAFFTTTDEAYFLTQNGSPAMRSIHAEFNQTVRAPLPEPTGTLATFSIRNIGYVLNQRPGQPIRLWAYDPKANSWIRKADFPGPARNRGIGFALARKGYFGLGITPEGQGLRDLWQYDSIADRWQYATEYPGQGNQLLAVFSAPDGAIPERAYVGWGYEAQSTASGIIRSVGCTDWWELTL